MLDELDFHDPIGIVSWEALDTAAVAPRRSLDYAGQVEIIASGRRADVVLLNADPFEGLNTLRHPRAVIVSGKELDREALDATEAGLRAADE